VQQIGVKNGSAEWLYHTGALLTVLWLLKFGDESSLVHVCVFDISLLLALWFYSSTQGDDANCENLRIKLE